MSPQTAVSQEILEIRVRLRAKTLVWRELVVPAEATLGELHEAIERAFEWSGGHRHIFTQGRTNYGPPGLGAPDGMLDENETRVGELLTDPGDALMYVYESTEEWCHDIRLMSVCEGDDWRSAVVCVRGEGACPPVDASGPSGYFESLLLLPNTQYSSIYGDMVGIAGLPNIEPEFHLGCPEILTGPLHHN